MTFIYYKKNSKYNKHNYWNYQILTMKIQRNVFVWNYSNKQKLVWNFKFLKIRPKTNKKYFILKKWQTCQTFFLFLIIFCEKSLVWVREIN